MSNSEARQHLRDALSILGLHYGKFGATARFVQAAEGRTTSASKALLAARVSCVTASETSRRISRSINLRQS